MLARPPLALEVMVAEGFRKPSAGKSTVVIIIIVGIIIIDVVAAKIGIDLKRYPSPPSSGLRCRSALTSGVVSFEFASFFTAVVSKITKP